MTEFPDDPRNLDDFQRLVEAILAMINSGTDPIQDELDQLERIYSAWVKLINQRLQESYELLKKGLRAECRQSCERPPNLLEAAMALDFPERPQWVAFLRDYGKPAPPELKADLAAEINGAYVKDEELSELMYYHRVYALAGSPLSTRIDLMRRIARKDASNPLWDKDLKTFEEVRHFEIQAEFKDASGRNDLSALEQLEQEVKSDAWRAAPPRDVVRKVSDACARMKVIAARTDLKRIAADLKAASAANDVVRGRAARDEWNKRQKDAQLAPGEAAGFGVTPPLSWLEQEEAKERRDRDYRSALAELQQALDAGCDRDTLDQKLESIDSFERELPEEVERRLTERYAQLDRAERKRRQIKRISIAAGVLAALGVAIWLIVSSMKESGFQAVVGELQQLYFQKEFDKLDARLEELQQKSPADYQRPEVQTLIGDSQQGRNRHEQFQSNLEKVRRLIRETPSPKSLEIARGMLDKLLADVADKEEAGQVDVLMEERKTVSERLAQQAAVEFGRQSDELNKKFEDLEDDDLEGAMAVQRQADDLLGASNVTAEVKKPLKGWRDDKVAARVNQLTLEKSDAELLAGITRSVGRAEDFRQQLDSYSAHSKFAVTPRAKSFKHIIDSEAPLWGGVERWNEFIDRNAGRDLLRLSATEAARLLDEIKPLQKSHGNLPQSDKARETADFLTKASKRPDAKKRLVQLLKLEIFTEPQMLVIEESKGKSAKKYYFLAKRPPQKLKDDLWQVQALTAPNLNAQLMNKQLKGKVLNRPAGASYDWSTPQSRFAAAALKRLDAPGADGGENWDATMLDILSSLQNETETDPNLRMDPIVKLSLLVSILKEAVGSSQNLFEILAVQRGFAEAIKLNPMPNWADPENDKARHECEAKLTHRDLLIPKKDTVSAEQRTGFQKADFGPLYRWVGWLHRDSDGVWIGDIAEQAGEALSGDLQILVRPDSNQPARFETVGQVNQGKVQLDAARELQFQEGRPLYCPVIPKQHQ